MLIDQQGKTWQTNNFPFFKLPRQTSHFSIKTLHRNLLPLVGSTANGWLFVLHLVWRLFSSGVISLLLRCCSGVVRVQALRAVPAYPFLEEPAWRRWRVWVVHEYAGVSLRALARLEEDARRPDRRGFHPGWFVGKGIRQGSRQGGLWWVLVVKVNSAFLSKGGPLWLTIPRVFETPF